MRLIQAANGRTRGKLIETGNRIQITDPSGRLLGWYDENQDKTFDRSGRYIGPGDQTMSLLED